MERAATGNPAAAPELFRNYRWATRRAPFAKLSKRQPALLLGKLHVTRIDAQPQPCTHPYGYEHYVALAHITRRKTADHIGLTFTRRIPLVKLLAIVEVVNQDERAARVGPRIKSD